MEVKALSPNVIAIEEGERVVITTTPWAARVVDIAEELRQIERNVNSTTWSGKEVILALKYPKPIDVELVYLLKNVAKRIGVFVAPERTIYWFDVRGFAGKEEAKLEELKVEVPIPK